jgi:hypothetical protein
MSDVKYMHLDLGEGKATLAIQEGADSRGACYYAQIAVAFCSPSDQFSKKRGRTIAFGRLLTNKHMVTIRRNPDESVADYAPAWLHRAVENKDPRLPGWAYRRNKCVPKMGRR